MASSSASYREVEDQYAIISIEGENDGALGIAFFVPDDQVLNDVLCIVGQFLTGRATDFEAMRYVMASLWQPSKERLRGDDPKRVVLNHLDIWVQIHGLQPGFKSDSVVENLGNFIGTYVKANPKNFQNVWRDYMRVRVTLDITVPLKRRRKLCRTAIEDGFWVEFKYEYIPTFCFICGIIGHSEKFCPTLFDTPAEKIVKPYGVWMRAQPRRKNNLVGCQWLRDGNETDDMFAGRFTGGAATALVVLQQQPLIEEAAYKGWGVDWSTCLGPIFGKLEKLRVAVGFDGLYSVDARGHGGGVAMLWHNNEDVQLLSYSFHHIDIQISEVASSPWRLTGLYGEPNRAVRHKTWDLLRSLKPESSLPWCIIGDLNNTTSHADKRGGNKYPQLLVDGFNQALSDCDLVDMELIGYPYTWERGRGIDSWIEIRLDRALVCSN
uniref:CCHC-type domain-containing protein n=1 Tax=Cannabis sativa TaxID=3483 RepID=A0A803PEU0_CANSA